MIVMRSRQSKISVRVVKSSKIIQIIWCIGDGMVWDGFKWTFVVWVFRGNLKYWLLRGRVFLGCMWYFIDRVRNFRNGRGAGRRCQYVMAFLTSTILYDIITILKISTSVHIKTLLVIIKNFYYPERIDQCLHYSRYLCPILIITNSK